MISSTKALEQSAAGADAQPWCPRCSQIEDTTEHHHTEARLQRLAERDHLTGLLNRRRLEEELQRTLAGVRRHGRRAALILVDLDHFKRSSAPWHAVRELLGMDVSYVTRHTEAEQVFLAVEGEAESFGVGVGTRMPLSETYCQASWRAFCRARCPTCGRSRWPPRCR